MRSTPTNQPIYSYFLTLFALIPNPWATRIQSQTKGLIPDNSKRILVLRYYGYSLSAYQTIIPAFLWVMENACESTNALPFEYLDLLNINNEEPRQALVGRKF